MAFTKSDAPLVAFKRGVGPVDQLPLPDGCYLEVWRPSIHRPCPKGVPGRWTFALAAIVFAALGRLKLYQVAFLHDRNGALLQASACFPRVRAFPFMNVDDAYALNLWTSPDHPARDLAVVGLNAVLCALSQLDGTRQVWWIAAPHDRRAIAVALANGFTPTASTPARRSSKLGDLIQRRFPSGEPFDYATITENWDTPANIEQREMSYLRHEVVRRSVGKGRLLDVACGTAYGFTHLSRDSELAVGVDLVWSNLEAARRRLPGAHFIQASADALPFRDLSFDVVSCLEAIYYFPNPNQSVLSMRRVLRKGGQLVISLPNRLRPGFNPSAGSTAYFSPSELDETLRDCAFDPRICGAFRWGDEGHLGRLMEIIRVAAVRVKVMPGSLAARAVVKRFAFRDMRPVAEFDRTIDADAALTPLVPPLFDGPFKVLVATAELDDV